MFFSNFYYFSTHISGFTSSAHTFHSIFVHYLTHMFIIHPSLFSLFPPYAVYIFQLLFTCVSFHLPLHQHSCLMLLLLLLCTCNCSLSLSRPSSNILPFVLSHLLCIFCPHEKKGKPNFKYPLIYMVK